MATEPFQVTHESLHHATNVLPDNVTALGDTRQTLLSRSVPASAFGEVEASAQAGQAHADTVTAKAGELEKSKGRLGDIITGIGRTTDQTAQLDEKQARKQQEQNAQLTQVADQQLGQRDKALKVLNGISEKNPVSVATVAKRPLEGYVQWTEGTGRNWMRNIEAGKIGDHYERDVPKLLASPPTDENLRALARGETEFWKTNSTLGWAGRLVGEDWRFGMLSEARTDWLNSLPPERANEIRGQLGLR